MAALAQSHAPSRGKEQRSSYTRCPCACSAEFSVAAMMLEPDVPNPPRERPAGSPILTAGGVVLAIAALYLGSEIFIPFALSILLGFILTPFVLRLRSWGVPRIAAVLVPVAAAFVLIAILTFIVGRQLVQLADNLPSYQATITQKIRSLQQSAPGGGLFDRVTTTLKDLSKELSPEDKPAEAMPSSAVAAKEPMTVRLERAQPSPLEIIRSVVGPLLAPLATGGLVIILLIFVMLEREDLRDRLIRLAGAGDLQRSTQAINDAAARVSRYLLMQLIVNLTYGVPLGVGLYLVGVPNAILWGLLAAVLRFIPYLGPFLAALFPVALAIAVDPGWTMLLWVVGIFLVCELVSNNVVEPWLYGSSTGLSSLAIIIAAIFWTTLWGPVGLFLSTPLTVCLVVIGRYVPQLEFLGVLLGSDPVLAPDEQLYQRLLAGNLEEATELAENHVDEKSSIDFYDSVAIPALRLAENDRARAGADTGYRRRVAETAICIVKEVADHVATESASARQAESEQGARVLCLAGRTELDHATAEMVAQVLDERGLNSRALPPIAVTQGAIGQLELDGIDVICICYLHANPQVYARYVCRRLKRRAPHVKLVACCWNLHFPRDQADDPGKQMSADAVMGSLQSIADQVETWLRSAIPDAAKAVVKSEHTKQEALLDLDLTERSERQLEHAGHEAARIFQTQFALASLARVRRPSATTSIAEGEVKAGSEAGLLDERVIAANEVLVSENVKEDDRFSDDSRVLEKGIQFYAGAPLRTATGEVVGCLSVIDTKPRKFGHADRARLQAMADELMLDLAGKSARS